MGLTRLLFLLNRVIVYLLLPRRFMSSMSSLTPVFLLRVDAAPFLLLLNSFYGPGTSCFKESLARSIVSFLLIMFVGILVARSGEPRFR